MTFHISSRCFGILLYKASNFNLLLWAVRLILNPCCTLLIFLALFTLSIATNGSCTTIDLALVSEPCSAQMIPPLSNSDHNGIFLNLKCQSTRLNVPTKRQLIWKYKLANFKAANEILSNVDLDSLLDNDINQAWYNWQGQFLVIMEDCIPKGMLPKMKQPPWITKEIRSAIYNGTNFTADLE